MTWFFRQKKLKFEPTNQMMIHVLHILNELNASGMERMMESSAEYWSRLNIKSTILSNGISHPFSSNLEKVGYEVISIPKMKSFRGFLILLKKIREINPQIVHNHSESFHGVIALAIRIIFPKMLIFRTVHNCFTNTGLAFISRWIQDRFEKWSSVTKISPSSDVHDHELSYWKNKTLVIENWVDINQIKELKLTTKSPSDNEFYTIILVGNCSFIKNHEMLFECLTYLHNIKVIHVGDMANATKKEIDLIKSLRQKNVEIELIEDANALNFFRQADLHVLPSLHEGFGLVVAESCLLEISTLVNDIKGVQWAHGLPKVSFFNSKSDLTNQIRVLIDLKTNYQSTPHESIENLYSRFHPFRGTLEYATLYKKQLLKS